MNYVNEYYSKNKDKHRDYEYKYRYGNRLSDYTKLFNWQNGCCAMCSRQDNHGKHFDVDHNHKTGKIRGLLCSGCNFVLGQVESNLCTTGLKFEQAQDYLAFFIDISDLEVYNKE